MFKIVFLLGSCLFHSSGLWCWLCDFCTVCWFLGHACVVFSQNRVWLPCLCSLSCLWPLPPTMSVQGGRVFWSLAHSCVPSPWNSVWHREGAQQILVEWMRCEIFYWNSILATLLQSNGPIKIITFKGYSIVEDFGKLVWPFGWQLIKGGGCKNGSAEYRSHSFLELEFEKKCSNILKVH